MPSRFRQRCFLASAVALAGAPSAVLADPPIPPPTVWLFGSGPAPGCLATQADDSFIVPMIKLEVETEYNSPEELVAELAEEIAANGNRPVAIWFHHFGNYLNYKQWGVPVVNGAEVLTPHDWQGYHEVSLHWHPLDAIDATLPMVLPPSWSGCSPALYWECRDTDPMTVCPDDLSYLYPLPDGTGATEIKVRRSRNFWNTHGIDDGRAWSEALFTAYLAYVDKEGNPLPTPSRFHLDCEHDLSFEEYAFKLWQQDARWDNPNTPIPGTTSTLADYWAEFLADLGTFYPTGWFPQPQGSPPVQHGFDWGCWGYSAQNYAFHNWGFSMGQLVGAGALEEAVFEPARAAFGTSVKCTEYGKSIRYDREHPYTHTSQHGATFLNKIHWEGKGDLQAPTLYFPVDIAHAVAGEDVWETSIRLNRRNLDNAIRSFGGRKELEMSPYIQAPWHNAPLGSTCDQTLLVSKDDARRMIALLRSRDVREIIFFNPVDCEDDENPNGPRQRHTDIADAIDQVWNSSLTSASVVVGVAALAQLDPSEAELLRFAHDNPYVDSANLVANDGTRSLTLETVFDTAYQGNHNGFSMHVEATVSSQGVTATIELWNTQTNAWTTIGSGIPVATGGERDALRARVDSFDPFLGTVGTPEEGKVRARVRFEHPSSGFSAQVDLVQLVATGTAWIGDANDDGSLDLSDVAAISGARSDPALYDPVLDTNCDGVITFTDLAIVFDNWGPRPAEFRSP